MKKIYNFFLVFSMGLLCIGAGATEVDYSVQAGLEHSDNVLRTDQNLVDETIAFVGVSADLSRDSADLNFSVKSDLNFISYLDGIFDDEILLNINGNAAWWIMPGRLNWEFHDSFGQIGIDPLAAITPRNRESTNYFSTGPNLLFRFAGNELVLGGRFVDDSYEESILDNQRLGATASFSRAIVAGRNLTLDASTERTDFESQHINSNFDRQSVSLGFTSQTSRSMLLVRLGGSQIHDYNDTFSTLLSQLRVERSWSDSTAVWVAWKSDYSDAGRAFSELQGIDSRFSETQNVIPTGDPFEMQNIEAGLRFASSAVSGTLTGFWFDEDYENTNVRDRQVMGVRFAADREISRTGTAGLTVNYADSDFALPGVSFNDLNLRAYYSMKLGSQLTGQVYLRRDRRDSGSNLVSDYTDDRIGLNVIYSRD